MKSREKKRGDVTSISIPHSFSNWLTGDKLEVTDAMLNEINDAIDRRGFAHLVMTGISLIINVKTGKMYTEKETLEEIKTTVERIDLMIRGLGK